MRASDDAAYMFRRAREEASKADRAAERGASPAEVAAHRELAIRYKVRALSQSSGSVPCVDAADALNRPIAH
ncbi:MAG: hypothetical protein QHC40_11590 [Sphingobium sp.]|nr:hypothetical protein [Sphingobium sp.]